MYKSEFNITPSPYNSPCYKGIECKHKKETNGKCRNNCSDYRLYEALRSDFRESKKNHYVSNEYKMEAIDRQNRRYGS